MTHGTLTELKKIGKVLLCTARNTRNIKNVANKHKPQQSSMPKKKKINLIP